MYIPSYIRLIGGSLLAGTFLSACSPSPQETTQAQDRDTTQVHSITLSETLHDAIGIELGQARQQTVSSLIKADGRVELPPENRATVSLPIGGKIRSVKALPGQAVRKGEVLGTLESFEFIQLQQDYLQQSSQLQFLKKELERQRILTDENVGARKNFEQAQANYLSTQALVQSLAAKLSILGVSTETLLQKGISPSVRILSPVNGYLSATNINLGKETTAGEVLFEVIDKKHVHIVLTVFERDAGRIREGQAVRAQLTDGSPPLEAYVYLIGKTLEGESRTLSVHAHVRNESQQRRLTPGSFVSALIATDERSALTIPTSALVRKGTHGFVYVQEQPRMYRRLPVEIRDTTDQGTTEVVAQEDLLRQRLVTKGAYLLDAEFSKRTESEVE